MSRTSFASATVVLIASAALAQQVGVRRTDLHRHDLSVAGREVIQTIVELEPGTTAPRHSHPGEEIIYVLEGTWEYTLEGQPPVIVKAGGVLFIPAGKIHSARIVGSDRGAELATYIVEKGKTAARASQRLSARTAVVRLSKPQRYSRLNRDLRLIDRPATMNSPCPR